MKNIDLDYYIIVCFSIFKNTFKNNIYIKLLYLLFIKKFFKIFTNEKKFYCKLLISYNKIIFYN